MTCTNVDSMAFEELDPSDSEEHISTKRTCVNAYDFFPNRYVHHYTALFCIRGIHTDTYVRIRRPALPMMFCTTAKYSNTNVFEMK